MKFIQKISLSAMLIGCCGGVFAQDIHFSQINMTPLLFNPANAGAFNGDQRATLNYKDQWRSVASAYKTLAFEFDMGLFKKKNKNYFGLGLQVLGDRAGDVNMGTTNVALNLAYHLSMSSNSHISAGISGGAGQRSINLQNGKWGNQYDGVTGYNSGLNSGETFVPQNFWYGDYSVGALWTYSTSSSTISAKDGVSSNVGVSYSHINTPKHSLIGTDEQFYPKLTAHGSFAFGIKNSNLELKPGFLYLRKNTSQEIMMGSMVKYVLKEDSKYTGLVKGAAVSVGGHYRWKDAIVLSGLMEFGSYAIGLSYDLNTSKLKTASNGKGGLELSLRFTNPNPFLYKGTSSARFL